MVAQYYLCALSLSCISVFPCFGAASIVLDVGRPVKITASTAKLQHAVNMAHRFHSALMPVVNLAKPAGNSEKAADGNVFLLDKYYLYLFFSILQR